MRGEMTAVNAVEDIEIRVNDQSVIVPFDAYCQIFNPNRAWLEVRSSKMTLSIEGGDAATYHRTMLHFDTRRVKRKTSWDVLGIAMNTTYYHRVVDEPAIAPDGNRLHPSK